MLLLRACPKCRGAIYFAGDPYGFYASCLNCGYLKDVENLDNVQEYGKGEAALRERVQKKAA